MAQVPRLELSPAAAAAILGTPDSDVRVEFLRPANHTWRLTHDGRAYFLKAHTKDWYDGSVEGAATTVRHEVVGHEILRASGVATARVVASSTDRDNPLGWPYLLTRELDGRPLVDLLPGLERGGPFELSGALCAIGEHLRARQRSTFEYPGYLLDIGGPAKPPDPNAWLHWICRFERFVQYACDTIADDKANGVSLGTLDAMARVFQRGLPGLRAAYEPLRFVHGDCHASTFFLVRKGNRWEVSGVLDLETCSAGCPLFDFLGIMIELARYLPAASHWWEPLFEAYGEEPEFELIRLLLVMTRHLSFVCGVRPWPGGREDILRHLLTARDWAELLDLDRIESTEPTESTESTESTEPDPNG